MSDFKNQISYRESEESTDQKSRESKLKGKINTK